MLRVCKWLKEIFDCIRYLNVYDPARCCDVYKKQGCSHVDGFLCDVKTCGILKKYKAENVICPVCGYYCLGNGGMGCIDKPSMLESFRRKD